MTHSSKINTELYEKLRRVLSKGDNVVGTGEAVPLPKNKACQKLLTNMYTEEEAMIITTCFTEGGEIKTLVALKKLTGIPREELKKKLEKMLEKGKIRKAGPYYFILPYSPGGFDAYFIASRDDPEKMKKVAEAHWELIDSGLNFEGSASNLGRFRVMPAMDSKTGLIEVNQPVDFENQILPYETIMEHIKTFPEPFALLYRCPCRQVTKLIGEPCKVTDEINCMISGIAAHNAIEHGTARQVSREKFIEHLKKAEKAGLVHQTTNVQSNSFFFCNCCSCCCGILKTIRKYRNYGAITKSNFEPNIDRDLCILCEKCMNICPMEAIYHHWPHQDDLSDNYMKIRLDYCIGCGLCASHCPSDAISLLKVRNYEPPENRQELLETLKQNRMH